MYGSTSITLGVMVFIVLIAAADQVPLADPLGSWMQTTALGLLGLCLGVLLIRIIPKLLDTNKSIADNHDRALEKLYIQLHHDSEKWNSRLHEDSEKLNSTLSDLKTTCAVAQSFWKDQIGKQPSGSDLQG